MRINSIIIVAAFLIIFLFLLFFQSTHKEDHSAMVTTVFNTEGGIVA